MKIENWDAIRDTLTKQKWSLMFQTMHLRLLVRHLGNCSKEAVIQDCAGGDTQHPWERVKSLNTNSWRCGWPSYVICWRSGNWLHGREDNRTKWRWMYIRKIQYYTYAEYLTIAHFSARTMEKLSLIFSCKNLLAAHETRRQQILTKTNQKRKSIT